MIKSDIFQHIDVTLKPDPTRTVVRPFSPGYPAAFAVPGHDRSQVIVDRILALDDATVAEELAGIRDSLDERHRDVDTMLLRRFDEVTGLVAKFETVPMGRRRLIGAYFSEEYAFEAAALFNPSIVLHPDQAGLAEGAVRFVMSLRGIGEGHVSSVTFRTGTWMPGGALEVDKPSPVAVPPIMKTGEVDGHATVTLHCGGSKTISETVLFPVLPSQRQGIEDVRLVRFIEDDGTASYHGTYTAFSGSEARSELLSGSDFHSFEMRPLAGSASNAKGMALFPRRIDGRYVMLGRQDNENIWLLFSDDLYTWDGGVKLIEPHAPWELIQLGNCGSPIEIDEGWLVLIHGVGMVRNYCMGACLLDRDDPSKIIARSRTPILEPQPDSRDGYVPNVVYSCGALVHGRTMLLPYGIADSITAFATVSVDDLLASMEPVAATP